MANVLKSVIISLAVLDRHVTVEEAVSLSRLEQEFQVRAIVLKKGLVCLFVTFKL